MEHILTFQLLASLNIQFNYLEVRLLLNVIFIHMVLTNYGLFCSSEIDRMSFFLMTF